MLPESRLSVGRMRAPSGPLPTVRGKVIDPSDDEYESARKVYNAMTERRPGWIVRCADVADVMSCVGFAREHAMPLATRGGAFSTRRRGGSSVRR